MKLNTLSKNSTCSIDGLIGDSQITERLSDLGLYKGLELECLGRAPFGGPLIFRFGSGILALREKEAACVLITPRT